MTPIERAWASVQQRVAEAAARAGRDPATVCIVAATKTVSVDRVAELVAAGCRHLGENRAQELLAKAPALVSPRVDSSPQWHFIGPLQRNKVKALSRWVTWWHTLDRDVLIPAITAQAPGAAVLIEVNLGAESQKAGCSLSELEPLFDRARRAGLRVEGLMTVPPHDEDPRPWFALLAERARALGLPQLSMGMSDDFEVAVEEGATMIRLGHVLFGDRPPPTP